MQGLQLEPDVLKGLVGIFFFKARELYILFVICDRGVTEVTEPIASPGSPQKCQDARILWPSNMY